MTWRDIPLFAATMVVTYLLHEGGHWAAGRALGYDMWVTLNAAGLNGGSYDTVWHGPAVTAAGQAVTVLQAVIAYAVVQSRRSVAAFAFLFSALMMRFAAMLVSISAPNDEAKIGEWIGVGPWVVFVLVVTGLLILTARAGKTLDFGWKSYGLAYLTASAVISAVVVGAANMPRLVL